MMRLSVQSMPLLRSSSSSSLFFFCRHVPSSPPVLLRYSVVKPLSIGGAKPSLSTSQISISRSSWKFKGGVGSVRASHQVSDAGSIDSPMMQAMENKIKEQLEAETVIVKDAYGDGRHVSIYVVSAAFEGQSAVNRQRMVYKAISEELQTTVHAVDQMITKTPAEAT